MVEVPSEERVKLLRVALSSCVDGDLGKDTEKIFDGSR